MSDSKTQYQRLEPQMCSELATFRKENEQLRHDLTETKQHLHEAENKIRSLEQQVTNVQRQVNGN